MKTFKVEKQSVPSYGATQIDFVKYFKADNIDALRTYLHQTFGKPTYYRHEETETKYRIEEIQVIKIPRIENQNAN